MHELSPGIYEDLITDELRRRIGELDPELVQRAGLQSVEAPDFLVRHVARLTRRSLRAQSGTGATQLGRQVAVVNRIVAAIAEIAPTAVGSEDLVADPHDLLLAITAPSDTPGSATFPPRPEIALSTGALLVNGRSQPRIGHEIAREMASANHVDLLCAFLKWQGVRIIEGAVRELIARGGRLRVITTTYIGATDQRAIDRLVELGATVKISYDTRSTRLHAKAWFFHRTSGLDTGYVGSSNLSRTALLDGLEWNVRLSAVEQGHVLRTFEATFDEYWEDPSFESYDPVRDGDRLREAIARERGGGADLPLAVTALDVRPYGFQREILDDLAAERELHGRWRNLVVMATGTGKTVVAALDYRRLRNAGTVSRLLFVAHREEILSQSLAVFRHVLRDGSFGEFLVGGQRPATWNHVFASVQSLAQLDLAQLSSEHFDMVIVDEFHHTMAPSYERLLGYLHPVVLLGLTATPERTDGLDVRSWFGGRTAVELRIWEALERGLLSPFQYFGSYDGVDLDAVRWQRGSYDVGELSRIYTGNHARARLILQQVMDRIAEPGRMRALGFCVSIAHAEFMADRFRAAGVPSMAITSRSAVQERDQALRRLADRSLNVLFTVDLFNEGIDLPVIDTVLFLRPTESATIFLQQLGRGLRLAEDKPCLTVLDFVGSQHAAFRFDLKLRALTGIGRRDLASEIESGFPTLPAGCHLELDRVAGHIVLDNVRRSLRLTWSSMVVELRRLGDIPMADFLVETGLDIEDLYRRDHGGWLGLRRAAGFEPTAETADDRQFGRAVGRLLHVDDPRRLDALRRLAGARPPGRGKQSAVEQRLEQMLAVSLLGRPVAAGALADQLRRRPDRQDELGQIADILWERMRRITLEDPRFAGLPLRIHSRYSKNEALTAFGVEHPEHVREGVKWVADQNADIFFVTLMKSDAHFSPSTMYADRAISPELFQWESQSTTSVDSPTGRRYLHHRVEGTTIHLFLRETKLSDGALGAPAYLYAGAMNYVDHTGERPIRITWRLDHPLPPDIFRAAKVATG